MNKEIYIEVCANSVESALAGQAGGAARIELCSNLLEGGTTPSLATIEFARKVLQIKLNVLIRPRGGDFLYNDFEFEIMKRDIQLCKELSVDGVVIGILHENGTIDMERMVELVSIARPMSVTFHRAFDMTRDPIEAMNDLLNLKVDRLLTSGQRNSVMENLELIRQLVQISSGSIAIMPGGGVNPLNAFNIVQETGVCELHLTGKKNVESKMTYHNPYVSMGNEASSSEYSYTVTDEETIRKIVSIFSHSSPR